MQKNASRPYLSACTKSSPNRSKLPLNLIKEEVGNSLEFMGTRDNFLNITPVAQTLRKTFNKRDILYMKRFYKAKEKVIKTKQQLTPHQTEH